MALFESYERRIDQINKLLNENGIKDLNEAKKICDDLGVDVYNIVKGIQPICFENACWAYIVGASVAIKKGILMPWAAPVMPGWAAILSRSKP